MSHRRPTSPRWLALLAGALAMAGQALAREQPRELIEARDELRDALPAEQRVELPTNPAGLVVAWLIEALNTGDLGENPESRFDPAYLRSVPLKDFASELAAMHTDAFDGRDARPVRIDQVSDRGDSISVAIAAEGGRIALNIFALVDDQGRIAALRIAPDTMRGATAARGGDGGGDRGANDGDDKDRRSRGWRGLTDELGDLPGTTALGVYELIPRDRSQPALGFELLVVAGRNEDTPLAIGSTFKLWVLGALAEDVAQGLHAWTDALPIDEARKSLPSGIMQTKPPGTSSPLAEYAELMIALSDNTATDHLIHLLGRERVEAFMGEHTEQAIRNRPLLTTREVFQLKLAPDATLRTRFANASVEARRAMLAPGGEVSSIQPTLELAQGWTTPRDIDTIEWFASVRDLATTMGALRSLELRTATPDAAAQPAQPAPLARALRTNPGLSFDRTIFPSVGFKGGSEPGVLQGTWLLERADRRWFVLSLTWNNPDDPVSTATWARFVSRAATLLARDGAFEGQAIKPGPPEGGL